MLLYEGVMLSGQHLRREPRVKKITALLKGRALTVGLLAVVGLACMSAIAFAASAIPADTAPVAGHYPVGCFAAGCHTVAVVPPPSGETSPVIPPVGPGVGKDSDDCSDTLQADDCNDALEADDCTDTIEAGAIEGSDDCADDAVEDAAKAKSGSVKAKGSDDCADDAAEDAAAAASGSHETVRVRVSEHADSGSSSVGKGISKAHSSNADDEGSGLDD
jgi:hypothetical protein